MDGCFALIVRIQLRRKNSDELPPVALTRAQRGAGPHHRSQCLLRHWREVRGVSQLGLSLGPRVSQRQISFIESDKSAPGMQTLIALAQVLDVPLRERNALLLAAGYAALYSDATWKCAGNEQRDPRACEHARDRHIIDRIGGKNNSGQVGQGTAPKSGTARPSQM